MLKQVIKNKNAKFFLEELAALGSNAFEIFDRII